MDQKDRDVVVQLAIAYAKAKLTPQMTPEDFVRLYFETLQKMLKLVSAM